MVLFYLLALLAIVSPNFDAVRGLICLQCDNVLQPRHCHTVVRCNEDEACFTTRSLVSQRYQLGCRKRGICSDGTSNVTKTCDECCTASLCNANGCGEPGYPATRGPVCYDCDYHNDQHPCTNIDICSIDEECSIQSRDEFGDQILISGCKLKHVCQSSSASPSTIIGRRSFQIARSSSKILCNECCSHDMCNLQCPIDHCYSSPCQHGNCFSDGSSGSSYRCHCHSGWSGLTCQQPDHCASSPCVNGVCVNELQEFHCQCYNGSYGHLCEHIDHCYASPCQHGNCSSDGLSYRCHCHSGWSGLTCQQPDYCASSPCVNGMCVNELQEFHCQCYNGSYGHLCEHIDHCSSSPCIHGNCTNNGTSFICKCLQGWNGTLCETDLGFDCLDILHRGLGYSDGVYSVRLKKSREIIRVYCDMTTDGGGWTVFQKRFNGSVDFYRNFLDYDNGFSSLYGEFWLGLKYIYKMTEGVVNELRLDLEKATGSTAYEVYQNFSISGYPNYTLHIGSYTGTAGDGGEGLSYNDDYPFSTYDKTQGPIKSCPVTEHGAWWYNYCTYANLNGEYITPGTVHTHDRGIAGVVFWQWTGGASLKTTEMKFRRK